MRVPRLLAKTQKQLHDWFVENHEKHDKVFLISYKKHTGKPFLSAIARMEEAICWGWIDTTAKRVDEDRWGTTYVKRGPNARWSTNTIARAEQMIASGRMQPPGLRAYKHGLTQPIHDSHAHKKATMPAALREALATSKKATEGFALYPPSTKRAIYTWIARAKRPETIKKRIKETIELAKNKQKPFTKDK